MVEVKLIHPMSTKQVLTWGFASVLAQGIYDLLTIHYVAILRDLTIGIFTGLFMYLTSVVAVKFRAKSDSK